VKVEITAKARLDLIDIGDYLERVASRRTALRWVTRLESKALGLAKRPHAGAELAELGGRRRLVVRPYIVVYRIVSKKLVQVVRVVHGARDLPALFADDPD
jgi:toxin ParE1/3/4